MNGIHFLRSEDFRLVNSNGQQLMYTNIPGFSLVLFYTPNCPHCKTIRPIFHSLPGKIGGCHIGIIDVLANKKCVFMSRQTVAPISVVPYVILYINGRPYMRYKGPAEDSKIIEFVVTVANQVKNIRQGTMPPPVKSPSQATTQPIANGASQAKIIQNEITKIPEFTIGHPKCEDGVCYLDFIKAYTS